MQSQHIWVVVFYETYLYIIITFMFILSYYLQSGHRTIEI